MKPLPMLATKAAPFDAEDYLFEVKWDGVRALAAVERAHPLNPHYYLAVLGTRPDRQGQGLGSAYLWPILSRCDDENLGAYLESSKESNIAFYRRHGFEVTGEIRLPDGLSGRRVAEATQMPVHVADDPLTCVVRGTGKVLEELDLMERTLVAETYARPPR